MEKDQYIKQVLTHSADAASINFTDAVLKRLNGLSAVPSYNQPLVPLKWQRLFLFAFGFVLIAILILCLSIGAADLGFTNWIKRQELLNIDSNKMLMFIVCFWTVFALNALLKKKFLSASNMLQPPFNLTDHNK